MIERISKNVCTLRLFLDDNFAEIDESELNRALKNKDVKVNGKKTDDKNLTVNVGDKVCVYFREDRLRVPFSVVYEDENVLIADKESGVTSEGLFDYLTRKGEYYFIHRLDRNTVGLIMFAKNKQTEKALLSAIKDRKIQKTYEAVVVGRMQKQQSTMTAYLIKNATDSIVKIVDKPTENAVKIITEYKVIKSNDELSLLEVTLHTGKTHQIRAHFAHIGHCLLGDEKYGNGNMNKKHGVKRQLLVAKRLKIFGTDGYLDGKTFVSNRSLDEYLK